MSPTIRPFLWRATTMFRTRFTSEEISDLVRPSQAVEQSPERGFGEAARFLYIQPGVRVYRPDWAY